MLSALFSDEVLKNKHNTSAIEVQPNMLLAARVIEHKPAVAMPLEEVRGDIVQYLTDKAAIELAEKEGRAALDKLKKGEAVALPGRRRRRYRCRSARACIPKARRRCSAPTRPSFRPMRASRRRRGDL